MGDITGTPGPEKLGTPPPKPAPGRILLSTFDQGTWWVDRTGTPHRISEMDDGYVQNVIEHLAHHCERYFIARVLLAIDDLIEATIRLEAHPDLIAAEAGAPTWADLTPEVWLESTELMRSLRARAPNLCGAAPTSPPRARSLSAEAGRVD